MLEVAMWCLQLGVHSLQITQWGIVTGGVGEAAEEVHHLLKHRGAEKNWHGEEQALLLQT